MAAEKSKVRVSLTKAILVKDFTAAFKDANIAEELATSLVYDLATAMPNTSLASQGTTSRAIMSIVQHSKSIVENIPVNAYWVAMSDAYFKAQIVEAKPVTARWVPGMPAPVAPVVEAEVLEEAEEAAQDAPDAEEPIDPFQ